MKAKVQAASDYQLVVEAAEAEYNNQRDSVGSSLRRAMAIKGALASFELKLNNANAELVEELKSIDSNFQ